MINSCKTQTCYIIFTTNGHRCTDVTVHCDYLILFASPNNLSDPNSFATSWHLCTNSLKYHIKLLFDELEKIHEAPSNFKRKLLWERSLQIENYKHNKHTTIATSPIFLNLHNCNYKLVFDVTLDLLSANLSNGAVNLWKIWDQRIRVTWSLNFK